MSSPETVDVDGLRIAYQRLGDGPPVVLLHGGLADHREWAGQLELAGDLTLVAWDAPGCGRSSEPPASFRMPDYAAVAAGFVAAIGLERPHVVGVSFGATLALALHRHDPSLPRSLVLASPYAGWAGSLPPEVVAERLSSSLLALDRGTVALAKGFLETLFGEHAAPERVESTREMLEDVHPVGARAMLHAMAECDLRDVLGEIDTPTLIVHGAEDVRSPTPVVQAVHEAIPGSSLRVLPGVGHACNIEAPAAFNAAVRSFVRDVDGR